MKALGPIVGLVASVAVGVAAAAPPSLGTGPERKPSPPSCPVPKGGYGGTVATVLEYKGAVYQGKTKLRRGSKLLKKGAICVVAERGSAKSGLLKFRIEKPNKVTTCEMRTDSRLILYPARSSAVMRFERGKSYCVTGKDPPRISKDNLYEQRNPWMRLLMKDPLFSVVSTGRRGTVKVKAGSIKVAGRVGDPVAVGPGQQVSVPAGGAAQDPVPLVETAEDKAAFAVLKKALPKPDFSGPAAGSSKALKRIYAAGEISAGLNTVERDPGIDPFLSDLFAFLASSWQIKLRKVVGDETAMVTPLASDTLDLAITSELTPAFGPFDTMPLVTDSRGVDWYVAIKSDKGFMEALRTFVRNAVNAGKYSSVYRAAFGAEPSFDILKPVLFG